MWGKLPKADQLERLRFWTVLGSLAELEEKYILRHIRILKQQLNWVLREIKGVEVIGVFEIEIFNFNVNCGSSGGG